MDFKISLPKIFGIFKRVFFGALGDLELDEKQCENQKYKPVHSGDESARVSQGGVETWGGEWNRGTWTHRTL
jgi:hypothetical protein